MDITAGPGFELWTGLDWIWIYMDEDIFAHWIIGRFHGEK